jgi:hypothetical protein
MVIDKTDGNIILGQNLLTSANHLIINCKFPMSAVCSSFYGQYITCSVIHSYRGGKYDISSVEYINFDTKSKTNG